MYSLVLLQIGHHILQLNAVFMHLQLFQMKSKRVIRTLIVATCIGLEQHSSPCLWLVTFNDIVHMLTQCLSIAGVRLYHTVTVLPGTGVVVFGGRCSPDKPIQGLCKVTFDPSGACDPPTSDTEEIVKLHIEPVVSTGNPPSARWRHTTTVVSHKGEFKCTVFSSLCVCVCVLFLCI